MDKSTQRIQPANIPIVDLPVSKVIRPRRLPRGQSSSNSDSCRRVDSQSLPGASPVPSLPSRIGTRYITPDGHIMSYRKRRETRPETSMTSRESPALLDLQPKQIDEEYEVCFAPKELRVRTLSRVYAAHFTVPRVSLSPKHSYPKQISNKRKCPHVPPKYIFARDPPTGHPASSLFPVLIQRPMLSTRVLPIKLTKASDSRRKREYSTDNNRGSPYNIKSALEEIRRLEASAKPARSHSNRVVQKVQDNKEGLEQGSTTSKSTNGLG